MNTLCIINWEACGAIANFLMAALALITIIATLWMRYSDNRARLIISIVERQSLFLLKIENIGKSPAYDIQLKVTGLPIQNNPLSLVKHTLEKLEKQRISIEQGKSTYYLIMTTSSTGINRFANKDENIDQNVIDEWINQYQNYPITIDIKYNNKYSAHQDLSIRDFLVSGSIQFDEDIVGAINELGHSVDFLKFSGHGRFGNRTLSGKNTTEILK